MRSCCIVLLALVVVVPIAHAQPLPNPYEPQPGFAQPACRLDPYRVEMVCDPSPLMELQTSHRYAVGEGIIGVPGRERGWLILLNLDYVPRLVQVDYLIGGSDTVYRLIRRLPPLSRESIALHEDPLFQGHAVAFSVVASFEAQGAVNLVTRPADNLWRAETIVAGVRIDQRP